MKNVYIFFLLFLNSLLFSQTATVINKVIGISDSLSYNTEIRIYKRYEITNGTDVLRIYEVNKNEWKAELYNYLQSAKGSEKSKFTLIKLNNKSNFNHIWNDISNTNILYLPDQKVIDYKLKGRSEIVLDHGEYFYSTLEIAFTDGISYEIFSKAGDKYNHVVYSNPEGYLTQFPEVDELESVCHLIDILKNEFSIWND